MVTQNKTELDLPGSHLLVTLLTVGHIDTESALDWLIAQTPKENNKNVRNE